MATYSHEFVENHAFMIKYTLGILRTSLGCTLGGTAGGSTEDPVEQTIMINIWDSSNFTHNIIMFNFTDDDTVIWMDRGRLHRYPRCITQNALLHKSCTFICRTNITKRQVRHDNALLHCNKALSHSKSHFLYIYLQHKHLQMSS